MFTGIIETVGRVVHIENDQQGSRLHLQPGKINPAMVDLGASIAVNGVCLTVCEFVAKGLLFDVSAETLSRTTLGQLSSGDRINLEQAVTPSTRLGGHFVNGHVDGMGKVISIMADGFSKIITVEIDNNLAKYIAIKGSVAIDGVSLTINQVNGKQFNLTLIPHTLQETTIGSYRPGQRINIEVDVIARYIERLISVDAMASPASAITAEFLNKHGFVR
ncbi:Riboflavin synthase eubacterial/eukaryotic [hydrothermal vent metagenome]|uniref:Riboflavin synthase n=1 Tax=hydrothermal vent metagenome TaxID=652676 RepID=A0A3B0Z696_9ZZZZ